MQTNSTGDHGGGKAQALTHHSSRESVRPLNWWLCWPGVVSQNATHWKRRRARAKCTGTCESSPRVSPNRKTKARKKKVERPALPKCCSMEHILRRLGHTLLEGCRYLVLIDKHDFVRILLALSLVLANAGIVVVFVTVLLQHPMNTAAVPP